MLEDYSVQVPIAEWNTQMKYWMKPEGHLFSTLLPPYVGTWQTSGMMRNGVLYPLRQPAHLIDVTESSLLRTPVGSEAEGGAVHPDDAAAEKRTLKLGWQILAHFGHLQSRDQKEVSTLPTVMATGPMRNSRRAMVTHPDKVSGVALNQALEFVAGILPIEFESWDEVPPAYQEFKPASEKIVNLPTPMVSDSYNDNMVSTQHVDGTMHSVSLAQLMQRQDLFPTPLSRDYKDGQAERIRDGKSQTDSVYLAVMHSGEVDYEAFHETVELLPTPTTMEHREIKSKERIAEMRAKSPGGYRNLRESVINEIDVTPDEAWGKFGQAILRWEIITGRKAPNPTEPDGRDGKHRLSPKFTEWMMGLPEGWITGVDLKRPEMLKCCGNGVVPQQAYLALQLLIGDRKEEIFNG